VEGGRQRGREEVERVGPGPERRKKEERKKKEEEKTKQQRTGGA
jgi:hypothetical protein